VYSDKPPSRAKVFEDASSTTDMRLWKVEGHDKTIHCARVLNPLVLCETSKKHGSSRITSDSDHAWAQLARVEKLEIEDSESIMTELPKRVATDLRNLTSLTITWTRIRVLPPAIFSLPIRTLYIQRNQLRNLNGIENARDLTTLDASNNQIEILPKSFGNLSSLVTLVLAANNLRELPVSIGNLRQLKTFDCSCNKLGTLPDAVCNLLELSSLDVSVNSLTVLPVSIGCLPSLNNLRARGNTLSSLPKSFSQLTTLQSLLLRRNCFTTVPAELAELKGLHTLNLRENQIRSFNVVIPALKTLILDYNNLTAIDRAITACVLLQILSVQYNNIREVPSDISRLNNLYSLHVSGNQISDYSASFSQLTVLRHLSMNETSVREFPKVILEMMWLTQLDMDNCIYLDQYVRIANKKGGLPAIREHFDNKKAADGLYANNEDIQQQRNEQSLNVSDNDVSITRGPLATLSSVIMRVTKRRSSADPNSTVKSAGKPVISNAISIFGIPQTRRSYTSVNKDSNQTQGTVAEVDSHEMSTIVGGADRSVASEGLVLRRPRLSRVDSDDVKNPEAPIRTKRQTFRVSQSNFADATATIDCLDTNLDMHDDDKTLSGKDSSASAQSGFMSTISESGEDSAAPATPAAPVIAEDDLVKKIETAAAGAESSPRGLLKPPPPAVKPKPARLVFIS